jgi:hypothetical protein
MLAQKVIIYVYGDLTYLNSPRFSYNSVKLINIWYC